MSNLMRNGALSVLVFLLACGGGTGDQGAASSSSAVSRSNRKPPPQREFAEIVISAPGLIDKLECKRRVSSALLPLGRYLIGPRVDVDGLKITARIDVAKADLGEIEGALRQVGYTTTIANRDKLPANLQKQEFRRPEGRTDTIEVGGWSKSASCGRRGGPPPRMIIQQLRNLGGVIWVECDLREDTLTTVTAPNGPSINELINRVRDAGLTARELDTSRKAPKALRDLATKSGKPLLLKFSQPNCNFCRKLDATTMRDERVKTVVEGMGLLEVDIDGHLKGHKRVELPGGNLDVGEWVRYFNISSTPALVVFKPDGSFKRVKGYVNADAMLSGLELE